MNTYSIKISEEGLNTIIDALDCYSRLGINQFRYCLEHNPHFQKLDWEKRDEIEKFLRKNIDDTNYGIYHHDVQKFTKAFEIKKECELFRAIKDKPIMEHLTNIYDGSMNRGDHLPQFFEGDKQLKHEIEISIPKKFIDKIKRLRYNNEYEKMWKLIDSFNKIKGSDYKISEDCKTLIISKPYKSSSQASSL